MSGHANVVLHWFNLNPLPSFPIDWYNGDPLQFTQIPRHVADANKRQGRVWVEEDLYCNFQRKHTSIG